MTRTSLLLDLAAIGLLGLALALHHFAGDHVPGLVVGMLTGLGIGAVVASLLHLRFARTCDMSTPAQRRRYLRDVVPVSIAYGAAMIGSALLLRHVDAPVLRAVVALLPLVFVALLLRATVRYIRQADEMQQRIEVEAVSLAAAFVSLVYFGGGLLQLARVIDLSASVAMLWVFPMTCLAYAVAKLVVSRRYG